MTNSLSLLLCFALLGCAFGAPTEYQRQKEAQKSPCQMSCEKAHKDTDKANRDRCVRICEAKKEMEEEKE